ncbi:hypothetical protein DOY81_011004, partial [Sarcophaga bullata]
MEMGNVSNLFSTQDLKGCRNNGFGYKWLDRCLDYITDEEQNAASTSHANFLER